MPVSDDTLVRRVLNDSDQRAFALLVERYQSQVRGYLRRLTRDHERADELAQDTFVRVWDKLAAYAGGNRFPAWLMRIAHNEFLQHYRKNKRYRMALERAEQTAIVVDEQTRQHRIEDEVPDLQRYMAVLDDEEKNTLWLFYAVGMTHREISDLHEVPLGTIKSRIHRGKEKIREHFLLGDAANG